MRPYERTIENGRAGAKLKIGDVVSAKGSSAVHSKNCPKDRDNNSKARVAALIEDMPGGVFLDRDLHGVRYWNAADLKKIGGKCDE